MFDKSALTHSVRFWLAKVSPDLTRRVFYSKYDKFLKTSELPNGWSEAELKLLPKLLKQDSVFIDVGANLGVYTYVASNLVKSTNILAFEPMPEYCHYLKTLFPESRVEKIALSVKEGKQTLKVPAISNKQYTARATLNTDFVEDNESVEKSTLMSVETTTLDGYLQEKSVSRVDIIKIDVEGHEHKVLMGAKKTLEKHMPTLIVEIEQRHHDYDIQEIVNEICAIGYLCMYFSNKTGQFEKLEEGELEYIQQVSEFGSKNYVNNFVFQPVNTRN